MRTISILSSLLLAAALGTACKKSDGVSKHGDTGVGCAWFRL